MIPERFGDRFAVGNGVEEGVIVGWDVVRWCQQPDGKVDVTTADRTVNSAKDNVERIEWDRGGSKS